MLNTSQRLVNKNTLTWWYVFKRSWRCLQDVFARRLEDILKTSWQDVLKMSWRRLDDVLKISWRRLEDVLKTSWRRIDKTNILVLTKTSSEDVWLIRIYSSLSRHLEDVLKRSFEDECLLGIINYVRNTYHRFPIQVLLWEVFVIDIVMEFLSFGYKKGETQEKVFCCFSFCSQSHIGTTLSLKLWRNFCLFRWLNFNRSFVKSLMNWIELKILIFLVKKRISLT